jgi:hypothetical protein
MSSAARYAVFSFMVVGLAVLIALFSGSEDRRHGLLLAVAVALPVQLIAFAVLQRSWGERSRFLVAWLGGILLRLVALGGLGLWVIRRDLPEPGWSLLGLVGLFFVLHLLEPIALRRVEDPR